MLIEILRQTIMITSLVLVMMLLIEYVNVVSRGSMGKNLARSKIKQIIVAALLGLIPGCIGGFAVVSMFTHNFISFGALVAAMIASTGDESFVMFSMFPKTAIGLNILLFILAVGVGWVVSFTVKSYHIPYPGKRHMQIHTHEIEPGHRSWKKTFHHIRNMSFPRAVLLLGLLLFLFGIITGQFEHGGHNIHAGPSGAHSGLGFENILFIGLALVVLCILVWVDEHFLEEHLWEHIIKKHFVKIFLWTLGALAGIEILIHYVDITPWLQENQLTVMFIAALIGLIPESGPNLIFVTLFFNGAIPFSILFANSVVQDGHSTLPLLAESKRNFFLLKGINLLVALIFGIVGYFMGW